MGCRSWCSGLHLSQIRRRLPFSVEGLIPGAYRAETWTGSKGMIQVEFNLGPNGDENLVLDFTRPIK